MSTKIILVGNPIKDLRLHDHRPVTPNYLTTFLVPEALVRPFRISHGPTPDMHGSTAIPSVIPVFSVYLNEISPRTAKMLNIANALLIDLRDLQNILGDILSVATSDIKPLLTSRAINKEQRGFWTKSWVMIVGVAVDTTNIEVQSNLLLNISQTIDRGVRNSSSMVYALHEVKGGIENLKDQISDIRVSIFFLSKKQGIMESLQPTTHRLSILVLKSCGLREWVGKTQEIKRFNGFCTGT